MRAKIICVLLMAGLVLALSSCKTKEKVSEHFTENIRIGSTETQEDICQDERHVCASSIEQAMQTSDRDSLVEKFRERIVVDSVGRILFKDSEYAKEHYQGNGVTKSDKLGRHRKSEVEQTTKQSQTEIDTTATANRDNTVKTSRQTNRWLLFIGLLVLLVVIGAIISRLTR